MDISSMTADQVKQQLVSMRRKQQAIERDLENCKGLQIAEKIPQALRAMKVLEASLSKKLEEVNMDLELLKVMEQYYAANP